MVRRRMPSNDNVSGWVVGCVVAGVVTPLISLSLSGPRLLPPELVGSYPAPAALGRGWKYFGSEKFWPIRAEPTAWVSSVVYEPSLARRDPSACTRKKAWPRPQMS